MTVKNNANDEQIVSSVSIYDV